MMPLFGEVELIQVPCKFGNPIRLRGSDLLQLTPRWAQKKGPASGQTRKVCWLGLTVMEDLRCPTDQN